VSCCPTRARTTAWSNLELLADHGSVNEADLLVPGPAGQFLVELKYYAGRVAGNGQRWSCGGGRVTYVENPLLSANRTAKRLRR
jgi:hypothetical protein